MNEENNPGLWTEYTAIIGKSSMEFKAPTLEKVIEEAKAWRQNCTLIDTKTGRIGWPS